MPNRPSCSALPSPLKWRRAVAHRTLAAQLTSLVLHHKNAISLLRSKTSLLPRPFPSSLLLRILSRTYSKPEASLRFFLFASSQLSLSPGLLELSTIASILVAGGHHSPAAGLFAPTLVSHALPNVLDSLLRASSSCNISQSKVLSFALELYCKSSSANAMETFRRMRVLKLVPSSRSINALLNFLYLSGEVHISWMVCAAALRLGSEMDDGFWVVLVCLLLHEGKLQRAETLMSSGFGVQSSNYDLVVGCYASRGEFGAALRALNGMEKKGFRPGLSTWSSILEESCRFGNLKMVGLVLKEMIVMDLLPVTSSLDFDWIIGKFCELGKTFAAMLIFEKARKGNYNLESASYGSVLQALAQKGRTNEALKVFEIVSQRRVSLDPGSIDLFVSGICRGEPMEKVDAVIMNAIGDGFLPKSLDLSRYVAETCRKGRWKEATELLNLSLDKGIMMNYSCFCPLMKHFCNHGFLDLAISVHERVKVLGGCLNSDSYNALLEALIMNGRTAESIGVFDNMKEKNVLSSFSFVIMIKALCHEKELRKAMNLHDEMMKLGLKPDTATYKQLISGFRAKFSLL